MSSEYNHDPTTKCNCICHESNRIIIHDHACCSVCLKCGFRDRCNCKYCIHDDSNIQKQDWR
jgi:hypothetical protein